MNNGKIMLAKILQNIQLTGITEKECLKSCGINTSFLTDWKSEKIKNPSVDKIVKLAVFLNIDLYDLLLGKKTAAVNLSENEKKLLNAYNNLSDEDKARVSERAETLAELAAERADKELAAKQPKKAVQIAKPAADEHPEPEDDELEQPLIKIMHSFYKVSAGRGFDLSGDDEWEEIEIPDTREARKADYALTIQGDSMEPIYYDGDIVLVKKQDAIDIGQIGIFVLDGSGYIKKYNKDRLISLNEKYDDILLKDYSDCRCDGRVIGRV